MRKIIFTALLLSLAFSGFAQEQKSYGHLYNPKADARADIQHAITRAQQEHKNVLLQIGGNWCIWCIRFHHLIETNDTLDKLMNAHFIFVPVNYDQHNKNDSLWSELGFPQRFGFPVFVILDKTGKVIHIQNSAYLEEGPGHSPDKVARFLKQWTPEAVSGKWLNR
jgi:thioredoxin-related protein